VNSFVFLALHRYFDGVVWHRVIPGFVAQTGDPTGTGRGGPGYTFGLEIVPGLGFDREGVVGMARTQDPNSNGSQFFITLGPAPHLTGAYTVFGRVVEGMEVVKRLAPTEGPGAGGERDRILSVEILVKE
jgi:cyclophilin family peptidyl-prolyl cis-trans isomerase